MFALGFTEGITRTETLFVSNCDRLSCTLTVKKYLPPGTSILR